MDDDDEDDGFGPTKEEAKLETKDQDFWGRVPEKDHEESRIVGWDNGTPVCQSDVRQIFAGQPAARIEFKALKKAASRSHVKEDPDPLKGLPPTWQAFYSAMPHQNAHEAFRAMQVQEAADKRLNDPDYNQAHGAESEEKLKADIRRLTDEIHQKKKVVAQKDRVCTEWDQKLLRVRHLETNDDERSRKLLKTVEAASFQNGIQRGKQRSSDIYFQFLYQDTKTDHTKKITSLQRSCALMQTQIESLGNEVRALLKAAADSGSTLAPSSRREGSGIASLPDPDRGATMSLGDLPDRVIVSTAAE